MIKAVPALAIALLLAVAAPTRADTLVAQYLSLLGPPDAYNSSGQPLDDLCAMVQQDRANWHKLGQREEHDSGDPFFNTTERRAMIAGKCIYDADFFANAANRIRNGSRTFPIYVEVFARNGRVSHVIVTEGAG